MLEPTELPLYGSSPPPSVYACDRFTAKLRTYGDMLTRCIDA